MMNKDIRMTTFQIALPPELAEFVTHAVSRGDYPSADAMVAAALERLRTRSNAETKTDLQLPPPVDLTRTAFDGPKFMAEMMDKLWAKK
jgi:Arc/MetJ-type ribon-helix-helix transcriptional regulator